jgi:hypothetical protein
MSAKVIAFEAVSRFLENPPVNPTCDEVLRHWATIFDQVVAEPCPDISPERAAQMMEETVNSETLREKLIYFGVKP